MISESRFDWLNRIAVYTQPCGIFPPSMKVQSTKSRYKCYVLLATLRKCNTVFHPKIKINVPYMMEILSSQFIKGTSAPYFKLIITHAQLSLGDPTGPENKYN